MGLRAIVLTILWAWASGTIANEQKMARITGIYSDLVQSQESGDLSGMEPIIIPSNNSVKTPYTVFVQIAEGGAPRTAIVPLTVNGLVIEFDFPEAGSMLKEHFVGVLIGNKLVVRWASGSEEELKRGKSYWQ